ncbi:MAG: hypothetical protein D6775_04485 [Caldilineae bacterium]|nr:MAG: hypothetical protein D6775_04485 [Caldilineae bacterium]
MNEPTLAIIDANIRSGQDELAREDVLARLGEYQEPCVRPLWVNWLRARADLRIVCLVNELAKLDDFLIDVVREAVGVTGTRAVLAFGGRVHIPALMDVPLAAAGTQSLYAATVRIELLPGYDRPAFNAIWSLPKHPHVRPVWLLRTYHSFDADVNMLLLSDDEPAITGYVMSWIRPVKGVVDTEISSVKDWQMLATAEELVEVAEQFFVEDRAG